jgi:PBS lyase HEAT-like repeat
MGSNFDPQRSIVGFLCQEFFAQPESVRRQIAIQLGDIGDELAIPALMNAIQQDPDLLAVEALAKIYQKIEYTRDRNLAISYLQQTISDLQITHPDLNNTNIDNVIDVEFTAIRQQDPQKWQRIEDVMSVVFAGGVEVVKILVPIAGIPIEVGKRLYEIWSRDR